MKIKFFSLVKCFLGHYYSNRELMKDVMNLVFSSIEFLLFFLPIFLILYGLTPKKIKNVTLVSGSLIFYAYGDVTRLFLLLISVVVNYMFGLHLGFNAKKSDSRRYNRRYSKAEKKRRILFPIAILFNVGFLLWFKVGLGDMGLPLGISFYTFQMISYLIDVRRQEQPRENSFVKFATYMVMFPQLVSGPIVEYGQVREALSERKFNAETIVDGFKVFTMGFAAKVLLADRIALLWQEIQVTGFESITTTMAWLGAMAYSLTLYFDFYGYSLMAIGLGKMFGFELPVNFHHPYLATSVRDFYRRWHMTLGQWFTKYVYIPLGGNRKGKLRTILNLFVVWVLTSLWHGGTINFLFWGLGLWLLIVLERLLDTPAMERFKDSFPGKMLSRIYLWMVIPISWMCFAITDLGELRSFLGRMFDVIPAISANDMDWRTALTNYGGLLLMGVFCCTTGMKKLFCRFKDSFVGTVILVGLFWGCVWMVQKQGQNPFLYFNF